MPEIPEIAIQRHIKKLIANIQDKYCLSWCILSAPGYERREYITGLWFYM